MIYSLSYKFFRAKQILLYFICILLFCGPIACAKKEYHDDVKRPVEGYMMGTIVHVAKAKVTEIPGYLMPAVGATLGGAAGYFIGGPKTTIAGIALGASLASLKDDSKGTITVLELTVELDSGEFILLHTNSEEYFLKGDRVRILLLEEDFVRVQLE